MPVNPMPNEPAVNIHVPPQGAPAQPSPQQQAADLLQARLGELQGLDPKALQVIMSLMLPVVGEMGRTMAMTMATELRKPSPEEQATVEKEMERLKQARLRAAEAGKLVADTIRDQQKRCQHLKPNGDHTFRGQVHASGWAQIKCQRCLVSFNVRPLPEHIANGLNLSEIRGLTVDHLRAWQANSAEIDRRIKASQEAMQGMAAQVGQMAGGAVNPTGL